MPDFQRISKKFLSGRAGLEDVVRVYQAVSKLPDILDILLSIGREKKEKQWHITDEAAATTMDQHYCNALEVIPYANACFQSPACVLTLQFPPQTCIENTAKLVELVETTIDFDSRDHQITVKAEFDSSLQEIAKKLDKTRTELNEQFGDTAEDLGFDVNNSKKCPLNFENHQVYGHCFRLTRKVGTVVSHLFALLLLDADRSALSADRKRELSRARRTISNSPTGKMVAFSRLRI